MKLFNGVTVGMNDFGVLTMAVLATILVTVLSAIVLYLLFGVIGGVAGYIIGSIFAAGVAVGICCIVHGCYGMISRIRTGRTS